MALPVTISGTAEPLAQCYGGPFLYGTAVYTFAPVPSTAAGIGAFKATDPTSAFSEVDGANRPTINTTTTATGVRYWAFQVGALIHLIAQSSTSEGDDPQYCRFDCAADAWVAFAGDTSPMAHSAIAPQVWGGSIVVRSGGEIVAAVQGSSEADMGSNYSRVRMARSTNATTWTVAEVSASAIDAIHFRSPMAVLGASDRVHIVYKDDTNNKLRCSTLLASNTWGSQNVAILTGDPEISANDFAVGRAVSWVSGASTLFAVPYMDSGGLTKVAVLTSADTPSAVSPEAAGDNAVLANAAGFGLHGLALNGTDRHLAYIRASDSDLYRDINAGSGWGTDSNEKALASVTHLSSNIFDRSGVKLAVVYWDGALKYDEISLAAAATVTVEIGAIEWVQEYPA